MAKILTKAYGEVEVPEENRIHFVQEIFGFAEYRDFYLLEMKDLENFYWLQSADEADLAFIVLNPRIFVHDYLLSIDDSDGALLEIGDDDVIEDFAIANIPENPADMTINLLGPVVVNVTKRIAIQAISNVNQYGTKYPCFKKEPVKQGEE